MFTELVCARGYTRCERTSPVVSVTVNVAALGPSDTVIVARLGVIGGILVALSFHAAGILGQEE